MKSWREDEINIAHMVERCKVLGPGERAVLWVQGCPRRCPGCHNPEFAPFIDAEWISVNELFNRIVSIKNIEGITISGGEPFMQSHALAKLAHMIKDTGLSVMVYSGFTLEELKSGIVPYAGELLGTIDLLIDGSFMKELPTSKLWRGSDNQRLIGLSDKYREYINIWNSPIGQQFEIRLLGKGKIEFLGIPPSEINSIQTLNNIKKDKENRS